MSNTPPLLKLPSELRNRIYEFALSTPTPLYYLEPRNGNKAFLHVRATSPHRPDYQAIEFNQLKYTNKQLYAETAGLELKLNDIVVCTQSYKESPADKLSAWLSSMSRAKAAWIKTIVIKFEISRQADRQHLERMPESAEALVQLTRLCKLHPSMTIKYTIPGWTCESYFTRFISIFFVDAICYIMAFRGQDRRDILFDERPDFMAFYMNIARAWQGDVDLGDLQAANLSYIPEDSVELAGTAREVLAGRTRGVTVLELEEEHDLVMKWLVHGI